MSSANSTIFKSKFKSHFLTTATLQLGFVWFINWAEGISYSAWRKLLRSTLGFIGVKKHTRSGGREKNRKKGTRWQRALEHANIQQKNEAVEEQLEAILDELETQKSVEDGNVKPELITMLKQFWERKHISQHIEETIFDSRNQELITYSKQSIMMSALAIFLFRMASGNKYDTKSHDKDEKYSRTNMAKFIDAPEERVPVIKTIEKFLKNLEEKNVNELMIAFFKDLRQSKFFKQHPQIMPGDFFLLAADCVHTHTYDHPHHTDMHGKRDCPYCLKRVYNKGTENEKVRWLHNTLVFCFVFMGGLKIPVYRHPIHAKQLVNLETASEEKHKQECELVALKAALPVIRAAFPKMKIVLLLDGLYANRPVIRFAEDCRCGYIIVRKDGCLPSLAKDCDGQAKLPTHQKNCVKRRQMTSHGWVVKQKYEWFNSVDIGEEDSLTTNVLRFWETRESGGETKSYKCEWLFSWRLSANTCEFGARLARVRWEEEDLFNTLKNRGFNLNHDYSRSPRSLFNWQGIALFAFGIFELFRFSEAVKQKGDLPQITLAEKLQGQLLYRPTEELFSERCLSIRIQFRYNFVVERILSKEVHQDGDPCALEAG